MPQFSKMDILGVFLGFSCCCDFMINQYNIFVLILTSLATYLERNCLKKIFF